MTLDPDIARRLQRQCNSLLSTAAAEVDGQPIRKQPEMTAFFGIVERFMDYFGSLASPSGETKLTGYKLLRPYPFAGRRVPAGALFVVDVDPRMLVCKTAVPHVTISANGIETNPNFEAVFATPKQPPANDADADIDIAKDPL